MKMNENFFMIDDNKKYLKNKIDQNSIFPLIWKIVIENLLIINLYQLLNRGTKALFRRTKTP